MKKTNKLFSILSLLLTLSFVLLTSSCYAFFQGKVSMDADGNTSSLEDLASEKVIITQLSAPSQIFVSDGLSPSVIKISWTKVSGATSYRLERAVVTSKNADDTFTAPDESAYEVISKYVYSTSYTDTIIAAPTYSDVEYGYGYFYRVSAENPRAGYDSSLYTISTAATLFAPVTTVNATLGESSSYIRVSWAKAKYASSYKVYRTTSSDGTNTSLVASVTSNQNWFKNTIEKDNQGDEFYYIIYAVNSTGNSSAASPIALGYSLVSGAPAKVSNVKVSDGLGRGDTTNSITIQWDEVTADSTVYYSIYRTSSLDSAYTLLATALSGVKTYTDKKSLKSNVYYYYQVQSYTIDAATGEVLKGPFSESGAVKADGSTANTNAAEGYVLSAPASLSVMKDASGCTLKFAAAIGSKLYSEDSKLSSDYNSYSYKVYSCDTQNGNFTLVATVADSQLTADSNNWYTTTTATSASFFKMSTVNDAGVESDLSTVTAPAPFAATGITASQHAKFDAGTYDDGTAYTFTADSSGVYPVKITWSAPEGGAAGGYTVYRSTKKDSGFRKVNDTAITNLCYVDSNDTAKTGTYYYYKVLSLNNLGQGANYSDVVVGYGALTYDQYMREYNKTVKASQKKLTLMHKSGNTAKLGSETINGDLSGTLYYNASIAGLGGRVIMLYTNYADYYINNDSTLGYYFYINGNTNTSASMDASGTMDGTVTCTGMYPGSVKYDDIKIVGGAAGGGNYVVTPDGFDAGNVSYTVGNE